VASVGFGAVHSWGDAGCFGFCRFIASIVPAELGSGFVVIALAANSS